MSGSRCQRRGQGRTPSFGGPPRVAMVPVCGAQPGVGALVCFFNSVRPMGRAVRGKRLPHTFAIITYHVACKVVYRHSWRFRQQSGLPSQPFEAKPLASRCEVTLAPLRQEEPAPGHGNSADDAQEGLRVQT